MFEAAVSEGVLRLRRPGTRWLSTGWDGGRSRADAAYNVSVPEGFERTDLGAYRDERLARAGFDVGGEDGETDGGVGETDGGVGETEDGIGRTDGDAPTLFTGVSMEHARGARFGPVVAYATVGLSNPAMLPMEPTGEAGGESGGEPGGEAVPEAGQGSPGTVNLVVGTTRRLADGAAANLVAVAAEAKATTLLATARVPGTTSDAIVVGDDPTGEPAAFSGSATPVGGAARVCVRDAIRASLRSRYPDDDLPGPAEDAEYGVVADSRAEVFNP